MPRTVLTHSAGRQYSCSFIIVTRIDEILAPLGSPAQRLYPNIRGAPVPGKSNYRDLVVQFLVAEGRGNA